MRRLGTMLAVTLATVLCRAAVAPAIGVGFYASAGAGISDWEGAGLVSGRESLHGGYGVVLDSDLHLAPFAYRLALGFEGIDTGVAAGLPRTSLTGFVVDQDITLDLAGPGPVRLRVGPELRLGYFSADGEAGPDGDLVALGLGPVLGMDFDIGPRMTVSWKLGYLLTGYASDSRSSFGHHSGAEVGEAHAYLSLALLFRTWDPGEPEARHPRHRRW